MIVAVLAEGPGESMFEGVELAVLLDLAIGAIASVSRSRNEDVPRAWSARDRRDGLVGRR